MSQTVVNLVALGLLGGAVAKSAQIPLHTWLPDAMEGPTPVSALIHAATMVTAGVYLIVRAHPIFELAPSIVRTSPPGSARSRCSSPASIALVQTDIKRVIAYSTMSQIGYMFLGAGLGAYGERDVPPDDARLLQGAALPRRRARHPPPRERAGHPEDGRAAASRCRGRTSRSWSARSRSSASRRSSGLLLEGLDPRLGAGLRRLRAAALRRRARRGAADRASTPSASSSSSSSASRRRSCSEHDHGPGAQRGAVDDDRARRACSPCSRSIGGWVQIAGVWHPFGEWLDPIAVGREHLALVEPTVTQDCGHERDRRRPRRARDLASPGCSTAPASGRCRGWPPCRRRSSTSSGSTSSTTSSSTGPPSSSPACFARGVEEPLIGGSIDGRHARRPRGRRRARRGADRLPPHVRARDRRRGRRPRRRLHLGAMTTALIAPPARRRARRVAAAAARARGRRARAARRPRRGGALGRSRSRASTSTEGLAAAGPAELVQRPRRLLPRRLLRLLALARRPHRRRLRGRDRLRALGRPRARPRVLRAAALPDGRDRRRLHRPGPAALLRLLRGDADPDLRPDRRLGRAAAACARPRRSSSTRWPARC